MTEAPEKQKALVYIENARNKTGNVPGLSKNISSKKIDKVGIIGAGTMGGGIAMAFVNAGLSVVLLEAEDEALKRGLEIIEKNYTRSVERGRFTKDQKMERLALIDPSLDFKDLGSCDLVIEAVFEDMSLKKRIFEPLSNTCGPDTILATNTSTLDVNEIARATRNPEKVLGLHFFSPANVMPLLEVVRGEKTSDETLVTAMELGRQICKIPVISGVCFGFIGNRMLQGYGREGQRMLLEGATPRKIDSALEDFGFAMGILAVYDLAGIDVVHKVREAMGDQCPDDPTFFKAAAVLYEAGRYGQKTRNGFYKYEPGSRERFDDEEAIRMLKDAAQKLAIDQREISIGEILDRCLLPLINEGAKILEEGIALRASDIDVVWIAGYGFPKIKGGPMFYADTIGLETVLAGIKKYREKFGPLYWEPAPLLEKLVKDGKTFADWDRQNT